MPIVRERTAADRQRIQRRIPYRAVYIAGLLAMFSIFAVQTGTRYVMNDWTNERIERIIANSLHRPVQLGRTTWALGLTGLIIATDTIEIKDKDRVSPFIRSGPTQLSVPLLPMLAGAFQLRTLSLQNPEVWATKIQPGVWNFSDLPQIPALKNIALIDLQAGSLHIIDRSSAQPANWSPRQFTGAAFHLERPFQSENWPFTLSFKMPHRTYNSSVYLTGIGNGAVQDWSINNHAFTLKARQINLAEFSEIWPSLPPITGLLNIDLSGKGVPSKSFSASAIITAPVLTVAPPGLGSMTIKNGVISGNFLFSTDYLKWTNLSVNLGRFVLKSSGQLADMRSRSPTYQAQLYAQTDDLNKLAAVLPAELLPRQLLPLPVVASVPPGHKNLITIEQALYPARLTGSGSINARITGHGQRNQIRATVRAANVSLASLADLRPFQQYPILGILTANPKARLDAHITIHPDGMVQINVGHIKIGHSSILYNGYLYPQKDLSHISFFSPGLDLTEATEPLRRQQTRAQVNKVLGLPTDASVFAAGLVKLNSVVDIRGLDQSVHTIITLKDINIAFNNGAIKINQVTGRIHVNDNQIYLENIVGKAGAAPFKVWGLMPSEPSGRIDLLYTGKRVEMDAVRAAIALFKVRTAGLPSSGLHGYLLDVTLSLKGTGTNPILTGSGRAQNLSFQPANLPGSVLINSGNLYIAGKQVYFQKIYGSIGSGTFTVNGQAGPDRSDFVLHGSNVDISYFRRALLDLHINAPILTGPQLVFGKVHNAVLSLQTEHGRTAYALTVVPDNVYYQPKGVPRTFVLTGGIVYADNKAVLMNQLKGRLAKGSFVINGRWQLSPAATANLHVVGKNLDLFSLQRTMQVLAVRVPLLTDQPLFGTLKVATLYLQGSIKKPDIDLVAYPGDIYFAADALKSIHLIGGMINYGDDQIVLNQAILKGPGSLASISLAINNLSTDAALTQLHLATNGIDLADTNNYQSWLRSLGISALHGKLVGRIDYKKTPADKQQYKLFADLTMSNVAADIHGVPLTNLSGRILSTSDDLALQNIRGQLASSPFQFNGMVSLHQAPTPVWQGVLSANLDLNDILSRLDKTGKLNNMIITSGLLPVEVAIYGDSERTAAVYKSTIAPQQLQLNTPVASFNKPNSKPIDLNGAFAYARSQPATLRFYQNQIHTGEHTLDWQGTLAWPSTATNNQTLVDLLVSLPTPIASSTLLSLFPAPDMAQIFKGTSGQTKGQLRITGPISALTYAGKIQLYDVSIPALGLCGINGNIFTPQRFTLQKLQDKIVFTGVTKARLEIESLYYNKLAITDLSAVISTKSTADGTIINVDRLKAALYDGAVMANGTILMDKQKPFTCQIGAHNVNLAKVSLAMSAKAAELTGMLCTDMRVQGFAGNQEQLLKSATADGSFLIENGNYKPLGQLESNLTRLNFFHQGILGFNLSNLLAAIHPKHNGAFHTLSGDIRLACRIVRLSQLLFNGELLHMRGSGAIDIASRDVQIHVTGKIPRNQKIFQGPIGDVLQHISIAKTMQIITGDAFANMPDIPILGTLASSKYRSFQLDFIGKLGDPDSFTKSAKKTFRWLPNRRSAPHTESGIAQDAENPL